MAKSSDQMKNMVEDYIKITGLKCVDNTQKVKEKFPNVEWQLGVGKITINKTSERNDRITVSSSVRFGKLIDKFNKLTDLEKSTAIGQINQFAVLKGVSVNWMTDSSKEQSEKTLSHYYTGLVVNTFIDEQELDRPIFFRTFETIFAVQGVANNILAQIMKLNVVQDISTDQPKGDMFQ